MFRRIKLYRAIRQFYRTLEQKYTLKPYYASIPMYEHVGLTVSLCFDIIENNVQVGHLMVSLDGDELYIGGFGRNVEQRRLSRRVGTMTTIIRELLDSLIAAGLTKVALRDLSNGYWAHLSQKYPTIKWEGIRYGKLNLFAAVFRPQFDAPQKSSLKTL